jgi:ABC-type nickel/cobalt efflux system permease component RcnA
MNPFYVKKFALIACLSIVMSCFFPDDGHAKNPFQAPGKKTEMQQSQGAPNPFYGKIFIWQGALKAKLSQTVRAFKTTGNYRSLIPVIAIAFLYGLLHAAGPGHGKVIAASYTVSRARKKFDGVYIGAITGLMHGFSGIALILAINVILRSHIMNSLDNITRISSIISYSLIFLTGLVLVIKNFVIVYRKTGPERHLYSGKYEVRPSGSLSMAIVIGMVPCPGTIIIMLFAMSVNLLSLGIVLSVAHTLGMVVTISIVGFIAAAGKLSALNTLDYVKREFADGIEIFLGLLASSAVMVTGGWLLFSLYY